ncbi:hypothetical protein PLICRDRAFT_563037 [Plicaturopsis crispa FD-325 SS-3]|nr:hypothetical protein PLICRDRAFT_563037 [Plicaturopsis crispa FD-325 SS-3]
MPMTARLSGTVGVNQKRRLLQSMISCTDDTFYLAYNSLFRLLSTDSYAYFSLLPSPPESHRTVTPLLPRYRISCSQLVTPRVPDCAIPLADHTAFGQILVNLLPLTYTDRQVLADPCATFTLPFSQRRHLASNAKSEIALAVRVSMTAAHTSTSATPPKLCHCTYNERASLPWALVGLAVPMLLGGILGEFDAFAISFSPSSIKYLGLLTRQLCTQLVLSTPATLSFIRGIVAFCDCTRSLGARGRGRHCPRTTTPLSSCALEHTRCFSVFCFFQTVPRASPQVVFWLRPILPSGRAAYHP